MSRTFAVIPAAGKSTRMGRPKLALELAGRSVLERVVHTLRAAGVEEVLAVIGPHVADLVELAERAGALVHLLDEETPDMRATIEAGLAWLEEHRQPTDDDHWLLVPADHPALDAEVVRQILSASAEQRRRIVIPTHEGKRGHPAVIPWQLVSAMRAAPADNGINHFFRAHPERVLELPAASADMLLDLDTPADYARLQQLFVERSSRPT